MSTSELLTLGAVAGLTIYLGLPMGRVRGASSQLRAFLNAASIGILLFLLWDVLSKGIEPVTSSLDRAAHHGGSWAHFAGQAGVFALALAVGLLSLGYYDRWLAARQRAPRITSAATALATASRIMPERPIHCSSVCQLYPSA